jgi:hypothetical protein
MSLSRKPAMTDCSHTNCSSALFALFPVSLNHGRVISLVESVGQCHPMLDWLRLGPDGLFNKLIYINLFANFVDSMCLYNE